MAYVFAREGDRVAGALLLSQARLGDRGPGHGLGLRQSRRLAARDRRTVAAAVTIDQGEAVGRPCRLGLEVDADRTIACRGRVVEIGRGTVTL